MRKTSYFKYYIGFVLGWFGYKILFVEMLYPLFDYLIFGWAAFVAVSEILLYFMTKWADKVDERNSRNYEGPSTPLPRAYQVEYIVDGELDSVHVSIIFKETGEEAELAVRESFPNKDLDIIKLKRIQ